ncbi:MAG: Tar ligand binding domain-containing protein [Spirochaetes bacterium]|nr:Tar ligand binding domain-containing protein [Spirochaetota bacterium]
MKWFNNLRVGIKVLSACMVFLFLLVVMAVFGIITINSSQNDFDNFYENKFKAVVQLNDIMKHMLQIRINMAVEEQAAKNGDIKEALKRHEDSKKRAKEYLGIWGNYKSSKLTPEETKLAEGWVKMGEGCRDARERFARAIEARNFRETEAALNDWVEGYRLLRDQTDKLIQLQKSVGAQISRDQKASSFNMRVLTILILGFAIAMGIMITMVLARSVSRPVVKGLEFSRRLADGDLTARIDMNQKDELGQLADALNTAAGSLDGLISSVTIASQNLSQAVDQISSGNQNLSQRTSQQASSLEEIASTIEEASATINQNAENSIKAQDLTEAGSAKSIEGNKIALEAVASIVDMNESSKKVADIIAVINEIAFQTNLLALNAVVEAARAGEQGRGFAVVAGEVRNLAQRSGNAAKEIEALIKDTVSKVSKSTDLVNRTGESLNEIAEASKTTARIITEIAAASQEQKQGMNQINTAISEMDSMTQQNASLVEETASASEEMANQALELLSMVEKFKITGGTVADTRRHREIHVKAAHAQEKALPEPQAQRIKDDGNGRKKEAAAPRAPLLPHDAKEDNLKDQMKMDGFEEF